MDYYKAFRSVNKTKERRKKEKEFREIMNEAINELHKILNGYE